MTEFQKLTVYLKDGRKIVGRYRRLDIDAKIEEAKKLPDFLEYRLELA